MAYKVPTSEPVAIVGCGCRFAGDATSPPGLWKLLSHPVDLSREVPPGRFNIKAFYHPDGGHHGTTDSPKAYWLEQDHRVFDASFFNITPMEAEAIDPQQRMCLEVVYEAMESAGYTLQQYAGTDVAVFAGVMTGDYETNAQRDELATSQYYATGNAKSIMSNRISYFFNFNGPSMTIDTACSSSLVALHQAVLSLRAGESTMACVTGANLMLTPEQFIAESKLHMLSPTGRCHMWDSRADGYARGEGIAALFLKPLSRALVDGDHIQGIIRETGVNSDGKTPGITLPNPEAQARLIRDTYRRSGLDPTHPKDRCQFFEAHGTGTQAGDPREAAAIEDAFFGNVSGLGPGAAIHAVAASERISSNVQESLSDAESIDGSRLMVGSIKTVIGHTEGAAGLAGVLKVVLSMQKGLVPSNLHLQNLNPSVEPFCKNLRIPTHTTPWPQPSHGQPRRASVNSFGFGGTNAHAIVEQYVPSVHDMVAQTFSPKLTLWRGLYTTELATGLPVGLPLLLSANSRAALVSVVKTYLNYLTANPSVQPEQLGWHAYAHRTALSYKVTVSATTSAELKTKLEALLKDPSNLGTLSRPADGPLKILGIFTGQGAQWATMSKQLLLTSSVYRDSIQSLDEILQQCMDPPSWSLRHEIMAETGFSRVGLAAISQPLCTAVQIAQVDLLRSLGITFHTVVGHSSGEIAAAYTAGKFSARDAILISYYRGLYAHLACGARGSRGGMVAVGLSRRDATELCARKEYRGGIHVAASNAPCSVTLSGDLEVVREVSDDLLKQKKFIRLLEVDTAYHSPHMQLPALRYIEALSSCGIAPSAGNGTVWVSSVDATHEPTSSELAGGYWRDNMMQPVLFQEAVQIALQEQGPFDCILEIGPHPALKGSVTQTAKTLQDQAIKYAGLFDRNKDDRMAFSEFVGKMWTWFGPGVAQLRKFIQESSRHDLSHHWLEDAPTYPWDHSQTYYHESRILRQYHHRTHSPHELLGTRTSDDDEYELRWRNVFHFDKIPWVEGHKFQGQAVLPASAYCVMAVDAAKVVLNGREAALIELEDVEFTSGIIMEPNSEGVEVMYSVRILPGSKDTPRQSAVEAAITMTSAPVDGKSHVKKNFSCKLRLVLAEPSPYALPPRVRGFSETFKVDENTFYSMMSDTGLGYSGPFRGILDLERRLNFSSAKVKKRHMDDTTKLSISPATLDVCFQSAFASYCSPGDKALWTPFLPDTIQMIRFNLALCSTKDDDGAVLSVDTFLTDMQPTSKDSPANFTVDIAVYDQNGDMEIQVEGLTVASFASTKPEDDCELYLTTVIELDPEDEIVSAPTCNQNEPCRGLVESCERVASFYLRETRVKNAPRDRPHSRLLALWSMSTKIRNGWPTDTTETLEEFIRRSPYVVSLDFIRTLGANLPDVLPGMLPIVLEEAHQLVNFQDHLCRVVRQISHRYPRMNVLGLTDPEFGLNAPILAGLKTSFLTYTIGTGDNVLFDPVAHSQFCNKVTVKRTDLEHGFGDEVVDAMYDLAIVSTSLIKTAGTATALKNLRHNMKPGAFLILVHASRSPLKARMRMAASSLSGTEDMFTPPDYLDILDQCGFKETMRNGYQYFLPGLTIIVRQVESDLKLSVLMPAREMDHLLTNHLLIVGGKTSHTADVAKKLAQQLRPCCYTLTAVSTLDNMELNSSDLSLATAAIFLQDLDEPVLSTMTKHRLEVVKALMRPTMIVLWVTCEARSGNPDHAASFGFARTMLAENPSLTLRILDIDSLDAHAHVLAPEFARLTMRQVARAGKQRDILWSHEPEVHVDRAGRRFVPRVLPWSAANDRVNAPRRLVVNSINTLKQGVDVVPIQSVDGSTYYEMKLCPSVPHTSPAPGQTMIEVEYSSIDMLKVDWAYSCHICLGHSMPGHGLVAAMSKVNGSFVSVPGTCVTSLGDAFINPPVFASLLVRYLTALSIADNVRDRSVLIIEPDDWFLECAKEIFLGRGITLEVCTTDVKKSRENPYMRLLHKTSTSREVKSVFPRDGAYVFDFLPETSMLSGAIVDALPGNCEYHSRYSLLASDHVNTLEDADSIQDIWRQGLNLALTKSMVLETTDIPPTVSVPELLSASGQPEAFQMVDWKRERTVAHTVKQLVEQQLFRPYKTYVLVGLTRDLGQSLCRLFMQHGARNIVLASRNPNQSPKWKDELNAEGANIRIEVLDVTNLEDVLRFKQKLSKDMPPVAGVVNGAMVLEDRVFPQMTLQTLDRVMRPKTVGTKNLDIVFDSPDMEFFIMTSSFAAIGGHAGQSNYAAANMVCASLLVTPLNPGLTSYHST
jgi:acyl transferase domain-containing protein